MRTKNSIRNLCYAFIGQFFGLIISFLARMVFVHTLNVEYLGVSGLFTNILNILCFTELGIGTSIAFCLYKPLEERDTEKIKTLMFFFKKVYCFLGVLILILGCCFLPFYKFTLNEIPNISDLNLIYILFVINTGISYFFSYKRTLVITDQKRYIATIYRYVFYFFLNVFQIIILLWFHNYILFLILQIIFTFLENYFLSKKVDKLYPELKEKNVKNIEKEELQNIITTFKSVVYHKFGGVILRTTDNICISKILGVFFVGLYSNYYMITNALDTIISQIFNSVVASIGNLNVNNTREKMENVFHKIFFLNSWIYGFCSICLISLANPFIELWLGKDYILDFSILIAIVLNFYIFGMRKTCMTFREATGNYELDKYSPLIEAVINIVSSIIFTKFFGLIGVFLGTILSCLCTCFWWEPLVIYKKSLKSNLTDYFKKYFLYSVVTLGLGVVTVLLCSFISKVNFITFFLRLFLCIIIPNITYYFIYRENKDFNFYKSLIKRKVCKEA